MATIRKIRVDLNSDEYANAEISLMDTHCFVIVTRHKNNCKKPLALRTKKCNNVTEAFQFFNELIQNYKKEGR